MFSPIIIRSKLSENIGWNYRRTLVSVLTYNHSLLEHLLTSAELDTKDLSVSFTDIKSISPDPE